MSLLSAHCSREQRSPCPAFLRLCTSFLYDFQSLLYSLHFSAFLGNVPIPNGQCAVLMCSARDDTELSKAGMEPCREEKHPHHTQSWAVAISLVLMIQKCVLNNASDQKYMPNKITYRTVKKQSAHRHSGSLPSVSSWGNGLVFSE